MRVHFLKFGILHCKKEEEHSVGLQFKARVYVVCFHRVEKMVVLMSRNTTVTFPGMSCYRLASG